MDKVSIVIPVYNNLHLTINCLNDVLNTYGVDIEIIVVDDCSTQPVSKAVSKMFPQIKLLKNEKNMGFAVTVNKGILASTGDYVCLLNNDIRLPNSKWLKNMIDNMAKYNWDMTAPAGGRMDKKWNYIPGEAKKHGDKFSYLVGWCLLIRRQVFDKIGFLPLNFGKGFFEDVLFGIRAKKAGIKMGITEGTDVQHLYHATFKSEGYNLAKEYDKKRKIFLEIVKKEKF